MKKIKVHCPECGKSYERDDDDRRTVCPHCGAYHIDMSGFDEEIEGEDNE